jgi:hypothetical protein
MFCFCFCFCACVVPGLELGAFTMSHTQPYFCEGIFEIGSRELFAQAGFELQFS